MAVDTRIVLQQTLKQQLVMTPQLRQAIKILQVSRAELRDRRHQIHPREKASSTRS